MSVGAAKVHWQDGRDFSLSRRVDTASGARSASYPMDTRGLFLPAREADHSLPASAEVKDGGAISPFHGVVLN
jgi:hypothetical protein